MNTQTTNNFQGQYVDDIRQVLVASLISGTNACLMSKAGWGKTVISQTIGEKVYANRFSLIPIAPTTSPAVIEGSVNQEVFLKESRVELKVDGTPYDPNVDVVLLDELFRGSDPLFDSALHATDPAKNKNSVVWASSNFVPKGERVEALLDRFALWLWITPEAVDVKALVKTQLSSNGSPTVAGKIPTAEEIEFVRSAEAGERASQAVADFLEELATEATMNGFAIHPRQVAHWSKIAYRMGVWVTGDADFESLPSEATSVFRWAWGSPDLDTAKKWSSVVTSLTDRVGTAIEAILANVVGDFKRVASIGDVAERRGEIPQLGLTVSDAEASLNELGNDPKVAEARALLMEWFSSAVSGRSPSY